jgi:glutathione synthase/RimK-type ligase-like ATP-grasp enzyme
MKILIACASDWTSIARLPRVLKRAGATVHALSAPARALLCTRYVDVRHQAPAPVDDFVGALRDHLERHRYDWVIVADDPLLTALTERRDLPWLRGILPVDGEWAAVLASKAELCLRGTAAGLPIPDTRVCHSPEEVRRAAVELGPPFMLKESAGFGGLGVRCVRALDELEPELAELDGWPLVLQRFIDGPIGNTVVLYRRGTPLAWMSAYKVRTCPGPFGPSSARRFMTHADVKPLVERIGALTGFHGFCAFDWVHAGDRLHLIELNARPVPTIHMSAHAGIDFSRAVRDLLHGGGAVQEPSEPPGDAPIVPMFPEDLIRGALEGELSLPLADVPWSDPSLLQFHVSRMWRARRSLTEVRSAFNLRLPT